MTLAIICRACDRPMGDASCDALGWRQPNGSILERTRYGASEPFAVPDRCGDCGVAVGAFHHANCDADACPHEVADPATVCDVCHLATT
jgi:hypothetical protein